MSFGWGCPHESEGRCRRRGDEECDPGAEACVLEEALHPGRPNAKNRPVGEESLRRGLP